MRMAMHPADQFEAFKSLADEGRGTEDIAARFGVTPTLVRQRLKLACVSPKFMQIYRDGQMSFDQLMAFRETKVYQYRAIVQGN
jgi:ParB family chromosome partitioning protein